MWATMLRRCDNKTQDSYKIYGARGIKVCDEWKTFVGFYNDMGTSYKDGLSIDRINSDGNYCKENCRWATAKEQARNRCSNKLLTFNDQTKSLAEWAELTGQTYSTIKLRLRRGWSVARALTETRKINQYG